MSILNFFFSRCRLNSMISVVFCFIKSDGVKFRRIFVYQPSFHSTTICSNSVYIDLERYILLQFTHLSFPRYHMLSSNFTAQHTKNLNNITSSYCTIENCLLTTDVHVLTSCKAFLSGTLLFCKMRM